MSLDRDLVFKADIYSQNEIEEIATNPKSQLALIDKFAEEPIRAINAEIQKSRRAIEQNSLELRSLDLRIREIQEVVPELEIVSKRLKEMQAVAGSDADLINRAHEHKALRAREAEAIKELRDLASSTAARFSRFASSVAESFANASDDDCRTGPNGTLFADIKIAVDEFAAVFTDAAPKIQSRSETLVLRLDEAARHLAEAHARQEQQYREIIAHSEKERQHATERGRLQQRHLELTRASHELDGLHQKRKDLQADMPDVDDKVVIAALDDFDTLWTSLFPAEQARIVQLLVARVTVSAAGIAVDLRHDGIGSLARQMMAPLLEKDAA